MKIQQTLKKLALKEKNFGGEKDNENLNWLEIRKRNSLKLFVKQTLDK